MVVVVRERGKGEGGLGWVGGTEYVRMAGESLGSEMMLRVREGL